MWPSSLHWRVAFIRTLPCGRRGRRLLVHLPADGVNVGGAREKHTEKSAPAAHANLVAHAPARPKTEDGSHGTRPPRGQSTAGAPPQTEPETSFPKTSLSEVLPSCVYLGVVQAPRSSCLPTRKRTTWQGDQRLQRDPSNQPELGGADNRTHDNDSLSSALVPSLRPISSWDDRPAALSRRLGVREGLGRATIIQMLTEVRGNFAPAGVPAALGRSMRPRWEATGLGRCLTSRASRLR